VDSCAERCGEQAPGGCWCDEQCYSYDDCCDDACAECELCGDPLAGFEPVGPCPDWMEEDVASCCNESEARRCVDGVLYVADCAVTDTLCAILDGVSSCTSESGDDTALTCAELQASAIPVDEPDVDASVDAGAGSEGSDTSSTEDGEDNGDSSGSDPAVGASDSGCASGSTGGTPWPLLLAAGCFLIGFQRRRMATR